MTFKDSLLEKVIQKHGFGSVVTRKQVIQALLDLKQPGTLYDHKVHRGQYSYALSPGTTYYTRTNSHGYLLRPSKRSKFYLDYQGQGKYIVQLS